MMQWIIDTQSLTFARKGLFYLVEINTKFIEI